LIDDLSAGGEYTPETYRARVLDDGRFRARVIDNGDVDNPGVLR